MLIYVIGFSLLLGHILTIKEQNKQILALLAQIQPERQIDPTDFPCDLPLKSYDDVKEFEEYLKASKKNCEKIVRNNEFILKFSLIFLCFLFIDILSCYSQRKRSSLQNQSDFEASYQRLSSIKL